MKLRVRTVLGAGIVLALGSATVVRVQQSKAAIANENPVISQDVRDLARLIGVLSAVAIVPPEPGTLVVDRRFGLEVAQVARDQLHRPDLGFRDDCSGFVSAVLSEFGLSVDGVVATLYAKAVENDAVHWDLEPIAGDLVFFDDTHDRDGDGILDDDLTHIGLVVDVEPDGTVVFAQAGLSIGRGLGRLNLYDPGARQDDNGRRLNTLLRNPRPGDPPGTVYLAGELFAGFARIDPSLDWEIRP